MKAYMLVITLFSAEGNQESIALSFDLSLHDCSEMVYVMERGINNNAVLTCEIDAMKGE